MGNTATLAGLVALTTTQACAGVWMVFLNVGPNKDTKDKEAIAQMQAEHVSNLARLGKERLGLFAGPLGDNGFIRGTVIVKAKDRAELVSHFGTDPFVQNGYLTIEAYPMDVAMSQFHVPRAKRPEMEQSTLVIVYKDQWLTKDLPRPDVLPSVRTWWDQGEVTMWGRLSESDSVIGVIYFHRTDAAHVQKLVEADPWVQAKKVRIRLHPQWAYKGILLPKTKPKGPK